MVFKCEALVIFYQCFFYWTFLSQSFLLDYFMDNMRGIEKPEFPHGNWKHPEIDGLPPEGSLFYIKDHASYTYGVWPEWRKHDWYMVVCQPYEMRRIIERNLRCLQP